VVEGIQNFPPAVASLTQQMIMVIHEQNLAGDPTPGRCSILGSEPLTLFPSPIRLRFLRSFRCERVNSRDFHPPNRRPRSACRRRSFKQSLLLATRIATNVNVLGVP
jgi:hypothetical protein